MLTFHQIVADKMDVVAVYDRFAEVPAEERNKVFWSCMLAVWNLALDRAAKIAESADRKPGAEDVPLDIRDAILRLKRPTEKDSERG